MLRGRSSKAELANLQRTVEGLENVQKYLKKCLEDSELTETRLKEEIQEQKAIIERLGKELNEERDQKQCLKGTLVYLSLLREANFDLHLF